MGFRFAFLFLLLGAGRLHAQAGGAGPFEFGAASGHPGETVLVPVHATFDHPLKFLFAPFLFDAERLEYLRYEVEGSEAAHLSPLSIGYRNYIPGEGSLGIFNSGVTSEDRVVPPGSRRYLGNLVFRVRAMAEPGEALVVFGLKDGQESFPASTFVSTLSTRGAFLRGDANHDGTLNITDPLDPRVPLPRGRCASLRRCRRLE